MTEDEAEEHAWLTQEDLFDDVLRPVCSEAFNKVQLETSPSHYVLGPTGLQEALLEEPGYAALEAAWRMGGEEAVIAIAIERARATRTFFDSAGVQRFVSTGERAVFAFTPRSQGKDTEGP